MIKRSHTFYAAALLALSTAAFAPAIANAQVGVSVVIGQAPPPLRFESVPPPRMGYIWSPGYWDWRNNRHQWVGGSWVVSRPGYIYHQPQWVQHDGRWLRQEARWDRGPNGDRDHDGIPNRYDHHDNRVDYRNDYRGDYRHDYRGGRGRGDQDRDGIPNRYDRDRDGDGVPNRYDRDRDGDGVPNRYDHRPDNPRRD
jgi:hypothetical protein